MSAAKRRKIIPDDPPITIMKTKSNELYDCCIAEKEIGEEFSLMDLLALGVSDNPDEMRDLCQELLDCHLFVPYSRRGNTFYRTRPKELALKLAKLHPDNFIIYNAIEGAGRNGIWKKTLSNKTNLHENTITKGMKELISKKLVKEFKTSKNPTKRMYVLFHLEPSEDSTGGNFYREGELDEGLVNTLNTFIVAQVESKSWLEQPYSPVDKAKKRNRSSHQPPPDTTTGFFKNMKSPRGNLLIPYPPSFSNYPTTEDVLAMIDDGEFIKDLTLTIDDVRQLVQQLIFDNKLEEMSEGRYRSVRRVWSEHFKQPDGGSNPALGPVDLDDDGYGPGNGLSYVPCGRCPVAKECRVGGIVSPEGCVYMKDWLESW